MNLLDILTGQASLAVILGPIGIALGEIGRRAVNRRRAANEDRAAELTAQALEADEGRKVVEWLEARNERQRDQINALEQHETETADEIRTMRAEMAAIRDEAVAHEATLLARIDGLTNEVTRQAEEIAHLRGLLSAHGIDTA